MNKQTFESLRAITRYMLSYLVGPGYCATGLLLFRVISMHV